VGRTEADRPTSHRRPVRVTVPRPQFDSFVHSFVHSFAGRLSEGSGDALRRLRAVTLSVHLKEIQGKQASSDADDGDRRRQSRRADPAKMALNSER